MLVSRIEAFVRDAAAGDFDALANEAFAFQFEHLPAYRSLCRRRGVGPDTIDDWRQVPMVPTLAFKSLDLSTDTPQETFRSSGTTSERRSSHGHPYPELYRATIEASFPAAALPATWSPEGRVPILSLIPSREQAPESSLGFMIDHVLSQWGDATSQYAIGPRGIDGKRLRAWLAGRQRDGQPALLLSTALALHEALEALDRLGLRFRLPPGSLVLETGGYKGRRLEVTQQELGRRVEASLGVPAAAIVGEYGMTELTSQLYTNRLTPTAIGPTRHFYPPPWVRIHVLAPQSLEPLPDGETGMVAILDLANLGSALHLLTEDLGSIEDGGLVLRGRARGAELRGCSLTAEELAAG